MSELRGAEHLRDGVRQLALWSPDGTLGDATVAWRQHPLNPSLRQIPLAEVSALGLSWYLSRMPPHLQVPLHPGTTTDLICVLAGNARYLTEAREVAIRAGDCLIQKPGISHGWQVGDDGLVLALAVMASPDGNPVGITLSNFDYDDA